MWAAGYSALRRSGDSETWIRYGYGPTRTGSAEGALAWRPNTSEPSASMGEGPSLELQRPSIRRTRVQNAVFLLLAFAFLVFAMFPGRFDGDAIGQYRKAWRSVQRHPFGHGCGVARDAVGHRPGPGTDVRAPACLFVAGLFILSDSLIATGRLIAGQAVSVLALAPLLSFDFFDVQKDALLSGLLAVLIGVGARGLLRGSRATLIGLLPTACILLLALDTRQNAIFALAPAVAAVLAVRHLGPAGSHLARDSAERLRFGGSGDRMDQPRCPRRSTRPPPIRPLHIRPGGNIRAHGSRRVAGHAPRFPGERGQMLFPAAMGRLQYGQGLPTRQRHRPRARAGQTWARAPDRPVARTDRTASHRLPGPPLTKLRMPRAPGLP